MGSRKKVFARTDAGNAELFASVSKHGLRYHHQRGHWLIWQGPWGGHWWAIDRTGLVVRRAIEVAKIRAREAQSLDEEEMKKEVAWALKTESRPRLEAMIAIAESHTVLADAGEGWDSAPMLFAVANGVLDLRTGKLHKGKPSDKITVHSDIVYDPKAKCPSWEQFLSQVFNFDKDLVEYVQRSVGYCLTGNISEQCFFLCYGSGANGKSTFVEILRRVFGQYGFNLPFSTFELQGRSPIPNDIAAIAGRRLVTSLETNESVQLNEARIKSLTGGDQITARFLYRELFEFSPAAKFWLACNHQPRVADDSPGFWRRVRLIPFLQSFEGREDRDLVAKLTAETPGILNWALEGCLKWQRDGLEAPAVIKAATDAYRQDSDRLAEFIEEECIVSPEKRVAASELWSRYIDWAKRSGERDSLDRKAFSRRMAKEFKKQRVGHRRNWAWLGIDVRDGSTDCEPGRVPSPLLPPTVRTDADVKNPIVTQ